MRLLIRHRFAIEPSEALAPNLANTTKELSKANDVVNPAAYKEILHLIKYVIDMKNLGLKIEPLENSKEP